MRILLLALAALLAAPAVAREIGSPPWPVPEDIDATGSVTPTDPLLIPDEGERPARRMNRPRERGPDTEAPIREFIPNNRHLTRPARPTDAAGASSACGMWLSHPRPHPEASVDRRSTDLEGGLQMSQRSLEPSFEAATRHLR